jgi:methyl-accepting chemotaxis protein
MTQPTPREHRPLRRTLVVDPLHQYRAATVITLLVGAFLVLLNIVLVAMRSGQTALIVGGMPNLAESLAADDTRMAVLAVIGSVILAGLVFLATVLATHRTAGAIVGVRRRIESVRDGDLATGLRLRSSDNLRSLEAPFNDMVSSLRRQVRDDAEVLERLATELEASTSADDTSRVVSAIRSQARSFRDRLGTSDEPVR